MSSASVPSTLPAPGIPVEKPGSPQLLRPTPERPRGRVRWLIIVLAIAGAARIAWIARQQVGAGTAKPEMASLRTATIASGDIERTIRVSGIVTAERFAVLMAPQLRGSRGASGAYGKAAGTSISSSSTSTSSSATSSSSTSSSSSSASSTAGSSNQAASAATSTNTALNGQSAASGAPGAPTSSLGAIRGTQNRFGDRQAQAASATTGTSSANNNATTSSTLGANGLGSTSNGLINTGGMGGGGGSGDSDFTMVIVALAKPGSRVKKGEVVAEFDRQYQSNRLDDYRATVFQLDANVKKLKADLASAKEAHDQLVYSAKADWEKALLDLKTAEVRSAIEAEDLKLSAEETEARYKQLVEEAKLVEGSQRSQILTAEIERDQAKLELDRATMNVNRMVVRAPMDGIAVMQSIWRGGDFGQVQQGDQLWPGRAFMQIVDPSSMVIMAALNQVDAESVRLGLRATARLDAYPGFDLPARVTGLGAMTKPGIWRPDYMREIPIRLKIEQIDARVIPDLSVSADIMLAVEKQATLAPLSAVFHDGGARPFVLLRTPTGWQRREIELGLRNHVAAAVHSGVSPGDVVATEKLSNTRAPS